MTPIHTTCVISGWDDGGGHEGGNYASGCCPVNKMGQVNIGNMRVYPGSSLPEPGMCLHLSGAGGTEWKSLDSKIYYIKWSGGINNGDADILESFLGRGDTVFGEDG